MGKIGQGILDGVRGKVGNVIGTSWKGIDCIRIKPDHVRNPRTVEQVEQRTKFKGITTFGRKLMFNIVRPIWDKKAIRMSGYNLFVQKNIDAFDTDGNLEDFSKLLMADGRLQLPEKMMIEVNPDVQCGVKINWENGGMDAITMKDKLLIIAINSSDKRIRTIYDLGITRIEGSANVVLPFEERSEVHLYIFFGSEKMKAFSPSEYASVTL